MQSTESITFTSTVRYASCKHSNCTLLCLVRVLNCIWYTMFTNTVVHTINDCHNWTVFHPLQIVSTVYSNMQCPMHALSTLRSQALYYTSGKHYYCTRLYLVPLLNTLYSLVLFSVPLLNTLIIQIIRYSQIISRTPMIQIIHAPLQSNLIINSRPRINSRAYYSVYIAENRPNFKR